MLMTRSRIILGMTTKTTRMNSASPSATASAINFAAHTAAAKSEVDNFDMSCRGMIFADPRLYRQLIANGHVKEVRQTDRYGRWLYVLKNGQMFYSTISPEKNYLYHGRQEH